MEGLRELVAAVEVAAAEVAAAEVVAAEVAAAEVVAADAGDVPRLNVRVAHSTMISFHRPAREY